MKNFEALQKLGQTIASRSYEVDEYSKDGKLRKRMFENTGKRAMKELYRNLQGITDKVVVFDRNLAHNSGRLALRLTIEKKKSLAVVVKLNHYKQMYIQLYRLDHIMDIPIHPSKMVNEYHINDIKFHQLIEAINELIDE